MRDRVKKAVFHLPHIGKRKMKSILALLVGFGLWQLVRLAVPGLEVHPIYIYIYGIIEMRESSEKTLDFGKRRIKATFIALSIGLPLVLLSGYLQGLTEHTWLELTIELSIILFGVLLTLCVAEVAGCKTFCGLAAAIFIVLIVSHSDGETVTYSLLRASQTILGVFVAWLINVKLFPYHGQKAQTTQK